MLHRALFLLLSFWLSVASAGTVSVLYPEAKSTELRQIQEDWRQGRMLEGLAQHLSNRFVLSGELTLVSAECRQANAFYVPERKAIVLCLELVPYLVDALFRERGPRADRTELVKTLAGALEFVLMHEVGHALIDAFELPVLGREEDAADQISAYLLLNDPSVPEFMRGALFFFHGNSNFFTQRHLSDEHSLNPQRKANLACWAYGKDRQKYGWALRSAGVTAQRAARCTREYEKLERSVQALMGSHMR